MLNEKLEEIGDFEVKIKPIFYKKITYFLHEELKMGGQSYD